MGSFSNSIKFLLFTILLWICGPISASAQTVINANDRGWYNNGGTHNPTNNNTFTGTYFSRQYHSYFRFTVPAEITCVESARLEIELENVYGGGTPHTVTLHDVDAPNVPLLDTTNGSGNGVAIFNDLGTGDIYGSQGGLTASNIGDILSFNLPAPAIASIEAAAGGDFAIGGRTTPNTNSTFFGLRFSAGNEQRIHRLTLSLCAIEPDLKVKKTVEVFDPQNQGLYGLPGNDVVYTISVVNEGTGSVDPNSLELIDAIPEQTIFYNGDIDDGGPEINPVAFSDNGSGLTWNYGTDVRYSDSSSAPAEFSDCNYGPVLGYDPNVTFICFNPKGIMGAGNPFPEFAVAFRVQVK